MCYECYVHSFLHHSMCVGGVVVCGCVYGVCSVHQYIMGCRTPSGPQSQSAHFQHVHNKSRVTGRAGYGGLIPIHTKALHWLFGSSWKQGYVSV